MLGSRQIVYDTRNPKAKRAIKLYGYVRHTDLPDRNGVGVVLGCSPNSSIISNSCELLEKILIDNLAMLHSGDIDTDSQAAARRYVWKLIGIGIGQFFVVRSEILVPFLEEAFKLAEQHGFIGAAKTASNILFVRTSNPQLDEAKYLYYYERNIYYEDLYLDYQLIQLQMQDIEAGMSRGEKRSVTQEALRQLTERARQANEQHNHPRLTLLYRYVQLRQAYIAEDYPRIIEIATDTINWLRNGPEYLATEETGLLIFLSDTFLVTDHFATGYSYLTQLLEVFDYPSAVQVKLLETKCLISLRTGHYNEAIVAVEALDHWHRQQKDNTSGVLRLFKAYLWILLKLEVITTEENNTPSWASRKKLDSVLPKPEAFAEDNDKQHARVLRIIDLLRQKKYKRAKSVLGALSKVRASADSPRQRYFFKMLELLFPQALHRVAVERHAAPLVKKLGQLPTTANSIRTFEEILPYEVVWSLVLSVLQHRRITVK